MIADELSDYHNPQEVPGVSILASRVRRFHDCLDEAMERHRDLQDDELFTVAVLEDLANGCRLMGLEQDFCVRMAGFNYLFDKDKEMIKSIFRSAYLREQMKTIPLKYMTKSALLTFKTEAYMKEHYLLRLNELTGVPEYKHRGVAYSFAPLDQAARNTMSINALKAGVDSWDKDLNRYIDSNLIPRYNPLEDYLTHLAPWDKKDRITELAQRVKTDNPHWVHDFHVWMLSMVAQWMGKNRQHGNAIVPLLIGPQGSGKTTFCRRLLPEDLQTYFNDRLSMKNDNDIYIAMSSYALINLDEFDAMSKAQQPILKYLLTKHDVKMRPPYGKVMEQRQRYASFIATTNNLRPLTDPTGSRRFVCVYADSIDNKGRLGHNQIFAQLVHELEQGQRYWMTDKENERLMAENARFQQVSDYASMIRLTYEKPEGTPTDAPLVAMQEIIDTLVNRFPTLKVTNSTSIILGKALRNLGYESKKTKTGIFYKIITSLSSPVINEP